MNTKQFYGHADQNYPERVDQVYTYIHERCGVIDAPMICKDIVYDECDDALDYRSEFEELDGHELANFLGDMYPNEWQEVCEAIDWMLEKGSITFSDDGELNCVL